MSSSEQISTYYDSYVTRQKKIGVNLRHRMIMHRLLKLGFAKTGRVLEIGCGIGTLTGLLRKYNRNASITATDISAENIRTARAFFGESIQWHVTDMSDFTADAPFDVIIFADVLEHIPVEQHGPLFKKLSALSHDETRICINIPHPDYLEWVTRNKPEQLQIIDQPLYTPLFLPGFSEAGFAIETLQSYSIWNNPPDYQWLVLKKQVRVERVVHKSKLAVKLLEWKTKVRIMLERFTS